jgi:hypothetical protein
MRYTKQIQIGFLVVALICAPVICRGEMVLGLDKTFIEAFKDKATISTRFHIDAVPSKADPHTIGEEGSQDGDIHMGGRDSVIRLPLVAEIVNARKEKLSLDFLKQLWNDKKFGQEVDLTGVWRIWFEHLSSTPQIQGQEFPTPSAGDSGMAHAFELHPVTMFGTFDTRDSFVPIESATKKFNGKGAVDAFKGEYETLKAIIAVNGNQVNITAGRGTLNYANFVMQLAAKPVSVGDGFIVSAKVFADGQEELPVLERNVRMVFVKDTKPAQALSGLVKGDRLHVLGVPRVNLHAVSLIVNKLKPNETFEGPLPYEIIIVAVYPNL